MSCFAGALLGMSLKGNQRKPPTLKPVSLFYTRVCTGLSRPPQVCQLLNTRGLMKVSKGQSQPKVVADIRLST